MVKKSIRVALGITFAATLTACGGGGGGGSAAPVANIDAQGYWSGQLSTGYTLNAAVLETGETWGVYTSGSTIYGALYGTASTSGSTITISGTDYNFLTNSSSSGTLRGPVAAKTSMSLSGNGVTAPLSYGVAYDTPASAAVLTGNWSFTGRSGSYTLIPGVISIDSAGRFTLVQSTCTSSGTIAPRAGGKNVYNVSITTAGSGCAAGQGTLAGIATVDTTVTPNKFLALALTPSKADGLIVIGTKQ